MKRNYLKKICICLILMIGIIFIGVSLTMNTEQISSQTFNEEEIILQNYNEVDVAVDYSNIENLIEKSDIIAIVKVISEEGSNYNEIKDQYVPIYTTGKLQLKEILLNKSQHLIEDNNDIEYVRLGGEITYSEYLKGLSIQEREKLERNVSEKVKMSTSQLAQKKVQDVYIDDIKIENEKEYIAFLRYSNDYEKFNIIGFEYGLREYNSANNSIKNNKNTTYESLDIMMEQLKK